MKTRLIYLYILAVFLTAGVYIFKQGEDIGIGKYKHSKNFELSLKAAYHFGYVDAKLGNKEDWDNGGDE